MSVTQEKTFGYIVMGVHSPNHMKLVLYKMHILARVHHKVRHFFIVPRVLLQIHLAASYSIVMAIHSLLTRFRMKLISCFSEWYIRMCRTSHGIQVWIFKMTQIFRGIHTMMAIAFLSHINIALSSQLQSLPSNSQLGKTLRRSLL